MKFFAITALGLLLCAPLWAQLSYEAENVVSSENSPKKVMQCSIYHYTYADIPFTKHNHILVDPLFVQTFQNLERFGSSKRLLKSRKWLLERTQVIDYNNNGDMIAEIFYDENHNIYSTRYLDYNSQGKLSTDITHDAHGHLKDNLTYHYNNEGLLTEIHHYYDHELQEITYLEYNKQHQIEHEKVISKSNETLSERKVHYNDAGQISWEQQQTSSSSHETSYSYDERGRLISTETRPTLVSSENLTGNMTSEHPFDENDTEFIVFEYDDSGRQTKMTRSHGQGGKKYSTSFSYDSRGRLTAGSTTVEKQEDYLPPLEDKKLIDYNRQNEKIAEVIYANSTKMDNDSGQKIFTRNLFKYSYFE